MEIQICTKCNKEKPLTREFYRYREYKGSKYFEKVCIKCQSKRTRELRSPHLIEFYKLLEKGLFKCNHCQEILPHTLEFFNKRTKRGYNGLSSYCKKCQTFLSMRSYKIHPVEGAIYLIWLGEKDKYYVGSTLNFFRRKNRWKNICLHDYYHKRDHKTEKDLYRAYQNTNFFSIHILEKIEQEDKTIYEKEKQWIMRVIIKHKNIYNLIA